jgi:hypothetical protein
MKRLIINADDFGLCCGLGGFLNFRGTREVLRVSLKVLTSEEL